MRGYTLKHSETFRQKDFFYTLAIDEIEIRNSEQVASHVKIPAIWFKRSKGAVAICEGFVSSYHRGEITSFSDLIEEGRFVTTYGGNPEFKWDGVRMWSATDVFSELVEARDRLNPLLEAFIEDKKIPDGYEGWFAL